MILETEEHARRRDAHIYAEVAGGALDERCLSYHRARSRRRRRAAAMAGALRATAMQPAEIDVIFAHGTSTLLNDATETRAIKAVFGVHAQRLAISATKSMIGHLVGAAGAVSALAAVLAIRDEIVPPTINLENPDPACDLDYVPNAARRMPVRAAMINAFGFGGQNVVLVLQRYEPRPGP